MFPNKISYMSQNTNQYNSHKTNFHIIGNMLSNTTQK